MKQKISVQDAKVLKKIDLNFVSVIFVLIIVGLINLYSATHGVTESINERLFTQQIFWLCIGGFAFFFATFVDYEFWRRMSWAFYGANLVALIAVRFVGKSFYGAQRWLDLGFFRYQPSETIKLAIVLVLANLLSRYQKREGLGAKELFLPAAVTFVPFFFTVRQPDLGTALLIAAIALSMVLFMKVKKSIMIFAVVASIVAVPVAWNFGLKEYQKNRVLNFLSPGRDPRGTGYNSIQSKIAVGSGKVFGKGFRKGTQSQLEFIPERHSDFIYSVLSEEHGFIGSILTLLLFAILFVTSINIAAKAKDTFGVLIVVGVLSIIFWHMLINIGMVIGILPIVGVPLPLLSYGGSSMVTTLFGLGLISSVAYRRYLF